MPKKRKGSLAEKRQKKQIILASVGGVVFVGLLVLVAFVARLESITIVDIDVSGTHFIQAQVAEQATQAALKGSYAFLVPHKNALMYPRGKIEQILKDTFPAIKHIAINRDGFTKLAISIEEREPVALWCESFETNSCYLLDETGLLFQPVDRSDAYVVFVGSIHGDKLGAHFLGGEFAALRETLAAVISSAGRNPDSVVVDMHDDIYVRFKEGGEIRFVRAYDPAVLMDNVASVFASRRFDTGEEFEYADFRFGNKVYVRFKEE